MRKISYYAVCQNYYPAWLFAKSYITLLAQQTKTCTFANRIDPDEMAHNEPSHLDLHCLPFCSCFIFPIPCFAIMDMPKLKMEESTSETQGVKGLK